MHPRRRPSSRQLAGFLRPRGDAPERASPSARAQWVPPPTRRCTRRRASSPRSPSGSSAHAEMHRCADRDVGRAVGFLRPRGDAPHPMSVSNREVEVPPPTRRCTRAFDDGGRVLGGSSAHAEMHRRRLPRRDVGQRFLRPRGDAPATIIVSKRAAGVPPPTRRCTRGDPETEGEHRGSSAHAEMHPGPGARRRARARFLRPRGDAPVLRSVVDTAQAVPPPTRRCTHDRTRRIDRALGSSAHAEMHPAGLRQQTPRCRFLRPRGDAPGTSLQQPIQGAVPPPTRRCTPSARRAHPPREGSSAHAEMHPLPGR